MQVASINQTNNRTNFGTLYHVDAKYTKQQMNVVNEIMQAFKTKPKYRRTIEDKYGRRGIDFTLKPEHTDDVVLTGHLGGLKKCGSEEGEMSYNREKAFYIGTYNSEHPFEPNDVHSRVKDEDTRLYRYIIPAALAIGLAVLTIVTNKFSPKNDTVKPLIENFDSAASKGKVFYPDSPKVLKKFPLKK